MGVGPNRTFTIIPNSAVIAPIFASQVLLAGGAVMNYQPVLGWYYIDPNRENRRLGPGKFLI